MKEIIKANIPNPAVGECRHTATYFKYTREKDQDNRAMLFFEIIKQALRKTADPACFPGPRYRTQWGIKSKRGMMEIFKRIAYELNPEQINDHLEILEKN